MCDWGQETANSGRSKFLGMLRVSQISILVAILD